MTLRSMLVPALRRLPRSLSVALLLVAGAGCGGIHFDVAQDLPEQRVAGNPIGGLLPSFAPNPVPITIDLRAETQKMGTGPAKRAQLASLTLTATPHGGGGNFDFLQEVHIYVEQKGGGLPKVEIATLKPVPTGQSTVTFTIVPNVDLLPYVNAGAVISATAMGSAPRMDFTYDGHIVITIFV